jgi:iron(III) transport system substrate-binding protein
MSRKTAVVAVALLLALATAGCSSSRDAMTIYSGRTQNLIGPLLEQFNKETGIAIDVKYGDSAELALLLDEEGERTPADIFLSQSPGATGFLAGKGRLGQLEAAVLDKVDERFRNADGRWVGISGRQRVLVYNSEQVAEADLPDSVLELTDERFAGKVAVAPSNGSFQDFVTAMRQLEGEEATAAWLKAMAANEPRT